MDAFDKDFKNALDRERAFEATDADWQDMAARLSRPSQPIAKPWWSNGRNRWTALCLLLLLGTSWGWWQTARDLARLKSAMHASMLTPSAIASAQTSANLPNPQTTGHKLADPDQPSTAATTLSKADQEHTVYSGGNSQKQPSSTAHTAHLPLTTARFAKSEGPLLPLAQPHDSQTPSDPIPPLPALPFAVSTAVVYAIPSLPLTPLGSPQGPLKRHQVLLFDNEPTPIVKKYRPKRFAIGLSAGGYMAGNGWEHSGGGHLAALQGTMALTRHLKLCGEVSYTNTHLRIHPNDRFGWHLPLEPPPAPGFDLSHIRWKPQGAAAGLGLRWQWRPERRWQPFAGAMAMVGHTWDDHLMYVFNNGTGDELSLERSLRQRNDTWMAGHLGAGLDWQIAQRLTFGAELFTRYATEGRHHDGTWMKGIRLHMNYKW